MQKSPSSGRNADSFPGATQRDGVVRTDGGSDGPTLREERTLTGMRRTIATRLQESYQQAVHVTVSREIDAEPLLEATRLAEEQTGQELSFFDLLIAALSRTLNVHPAFNATFEDETHKLYEEHNIGIAVDIDSGLVTPVMRDVEAKSLSEINGVRRELVSSMQAGEYSMQDFKGGTFTVSNLGPLGVETFDPIINPPEIAILGVCALTKRARPDDGDVTFRRMLPLDLSFDHRVVDGADAARFLDTLASQLQDSEALLSDV